MKKLVFLSFFMISISIVAQKTVNNYEYVVVDGQFDFLKKTDQYQTSSLTTFLFNKYGFKAFINTDDLPSEITNNRCNALFASAKKVSSMLTTKMSIVFKDCNGKVVFTSIVGKSKEKEYKKTYHEAIRNAFLDPVIQGYKYTEQKNTVVASQTKIVTPKSETPTTTQKILLTGNKKPIVIATEVPKQLLKKTPVRSEVKSTTTTLYAQANENGFQLIDTTPKVIFKILKTNQINLFIVEDKNGIFYKSGSGWIVEYYENGKLIQKEYQVKF